MIVREKEGQKGRRLPDFVAGDADEFKFVSLRKSWLSSSSTECNHCSPL
jgi:hypothetical protein